MTISIYLSSSKDKKNFAFYLLYDCF